MLDEQAQLLTRNLSDVFNERNASKRLAVIGEIYIEGATFFEEDGSFQGLGPINERITALLHSFPPEFVFEPVGQAMSNHNVAKLAWSLGPENGPPAVMGIDVAILEKGKIAVLYVFIDV